MKKVFYIDNVSSYNFYHLEVVVRVSETQLQIDKTDSDLSKWMSILHFFQTDFTFKYLKSQSWKLIQPSMNPMLIQFLPFKDSLFKHGILIHCWFNGPPSATLNQQWFYVCVLFVRIISAVHTVYFLSHRPWGDYSTVEDRLTSPAACVWRGRNCSRVPEVTARQRQISLFSSLTAKQTWTQNKLCQRWVLEDHLSQQ